MFVTRAMCDTARVLEFVRWQKGLAASHAAASLAAFVIVFAYDIDWTIPVHLSYNVWSSTNSSCSGETPCTVLEYRKTLPHQLSVGTMVACFSVFSAGHHIFMADTLRAGRVFAVGINTARWADYAGSATLMLVVNSVLWLSPPSVHDLVLWGSLQFLVVVVGWASEITWTARAVRQYAMPLFLAAFLPFLAAWVTQWAAIAVGASDGYAHDAYPVLQNATVTAQLALTRRQPPVFVWLILGWLCASFMAFPACHASKIWGIPDEATNFRYEVYYGFLSFFSKIPLLCVYMTAVIGRSSNTVQTAPSSMTNTTRDSSSDTEDSNARIALGVSAVACAALGVAMYWRLIHRQQHEARTHGRITVLLIPFDT